MKAVDEHQQVEHVASDLRRQFAGLPETVVSAEVQAGVSAFQNARIRTYVPVLVQKRVRDRLRILTASPV